MSDNILKIGDKVTWRGSWGTAAPQTATIVSIDLCEQGQGPTEHVLFERTSHREEVKKFWVPMELIEKIVAGRIRKKGIEKLEAMTDKEILGILYAET